MKKQIFLPTLIAAALAACGGSGPPGEPETAEPAAGEVKYGIEVQAGPMDSILLKDYEPENSLVLPRSEVDKARFPVIDVHAHPSMGNIKTAADVDDWVRAMDEVGVEKTVLLSGAMGEDFDRLVDLFLKTHPDRFALFCGIDKRDIEAPDYPRRAVAELERCFRLGARGVGEIADKGWGLLGSADEPLPRDKRLHHNDPRLDPFWDKCAELNIPVNIHVADHPSCWTPLGPEQERTPDFQHFNLYGKDVPSFEELQVNRDDLLEKHRATTFIACHLSNQGNDLAAAGAALERHPNLYLDISARDYELGRQPRNARRFLTRYKDRVMFGTDMGREAEMYRRWWRLLETADEFLPGRVWWALYGLDLPEDVLQNLYRDNALRVLNWE